MSAVRNPLWIIVTGMACLFAAMRGVSPGLKSNGTTTNIHETHFGATVLLGVTVPIYDGGLRRACEGQARADAAKTDARWSRFATGRPGRLLAQPIESARGWWSLSYLAVWAMFGARDARRDKITRTG
jgi:hypothetical protein